MYCNYRDALLLGKTVEQPVKEHPSHKKVYKNYSTGDIKKMCIWGNINELKLVHPSHFTSENSNVFIKLMKEKIIEIENWKYEDKNQYDGIIQEFNERVIGISNCLDYINQIIKSNGQIKNKLEQPNPEGSVDQLVQDVQHNQTE